MIEYKESLLEKEAKLKTGEEMLTIISDILVEAGDVGRYDERMNEYEKVYEVLEDRVLSLRIDLEKDRREEEKEDVI